MSTEIQRKDKSTMVKGDPFQNLIERVVEEKMSVDVLERLIDLRNKVAQEKARQAYFNALSELQKELPIIQKTREVYNQDGSLRFKYAPLEDILKEIKPLLVKHGFSYHWKQKSYEDGSIEVTCVVTHQQGHSESVTFRTKIHETKFMNDIQRLGATITYAKRYTLCSLLGIIVADEDNEQILVETVKTEPVKNGVENPVKNHKEITKSEEEYIRSLVYKITKKQFPREEPAYLQNLTDFETKRLTENLKSQKDVKILINRLLAVIKYLQGDEEFKDTYEKFTSWQDKEIFPYIAPKNQKQEETTEEKAEEAESSESKEETEDRLRKKIFALLNGLGIKDRDERLKLFSEILGRKVESFKDLTDDEKLLIIAELEEKRRVVPW